MYREWYKKLVCKILLFRISKTNKLVLLLAPLFLGSVEQSQSHEHIEDHLERQITQHLQTPSLDPVYPASRSGRREGIYGLQPYVAANRIQFSRGRLLASV